MITIEFNRIDMSNGRGSTYRILDVGCGTGRHLPAALRHDGVRIIGADVSFHELRKAEERLKLHEHVGGIKGRWQIVNSHIAQLPFHTNYFDLVICCEVLEHIPDDGKALKEIVRVLKPGQTMVVSVPRFLPEKICWRLSGAYRLSAGGHLRIYRARSLINLLKSFGLIKQTSHFAHSLHSPYWWLKCLIGLECNDSWLINLYHRFLVWDMMQRPWVTGFIDRLLNPIMGKSLVIYLQKQTLT